MGTVSRVHTFASGAILTAAQLNNEFDNLLTSSAINGGLDATNLGVTAGQATASKALVVDASRNLADATGSNRINNLALSGTFESTGAITATAGITSGGNIVSDTDSTDDLGTTGVRWANLFVDDITVTNNVTIGGTLTLTGGITLNGNTTIGDSSADTLTVNSTVTSNLIFTDNTYDIGASGATRPRNLYLSGNGVVGGTLGVTGLITATGGVSGALTGDVTGNISGNVTGGTISGTTGTFSGDVAVNTSTLKVDTSNNRVGVKNASPSYPLDIGYTAGINQVAWRGSTNEIGFLTYGSSTDAGAVQLSSGGAAKILFDAAGNSYINTGSNFGINTASPTEELDIQGSGATQTIRLIRTDASTAGGITINSANGSNYVYNTAAKDLVLSADNGATQTKLHSSGDFSVNTSQLFVDQSTARVGVNTASPNYPLQVMGEVFAGVMPGFETAGKFYLGRGDGTGTDVRYHYVEANNSTTDSSNYLTFNIHTGATATSTTEVLRLQGNGRVGINESSPTHKLSVTDTSGSVARFVGINNYNYDIESQGDDTLWDHEIGSGNAKFSWSSSSAELMRLDTTGLGVGTSSAGEKLTVVGGGSTTSTANFTGGAAANDNSTLASDYGMFFQIDANNTVGGRTYNWRVGGKGYSDGTSLMTLNASGNLLVGGDSQSGTANRAAVFSANKFGLSIIDTTAQAAGVGGALNLGGNYRSAGDAQAFARVEAVKENATDANYAYGMAFSTTPNGSTFTEAVRIDSVGRVGINITDTKNAMLYVEQDSTSTAGGIQIGRSGGGAAWAISNVSSALRFGVDNTGDGVVDINAVTFDYQGLVGIGTSSPEAPLEVVADSLQGYAVFLEAAASGTEGAALRGKGTYSVANAGTQTFTVGNGAIVMVSENNTGDGAMFFCGYKSATVTLVADPNSRYANSVTAGKISLTKSASSGTVTLTNNSGGTKSFTILKIVCSD